MTVPNHGSTEKAIVLPSARAVTITGKPTEEKKLKSYIVCPRGSDLFYVVTIQNRSLLLGHTVDCELMGQFFDVCTGYTK